MSVGDMPVEVIISPEYPLEPNVASSIPSTGTAALAGDAPSTDTSDAATRLETASSDTRRRRRVRTAETARRTRTFPQLLTGIRARQIRSYRVSPRISPQPSPQLWADLLDDLGLDEDNDIDMDELVRAGEWTVPCSSRPGNWCLQRSET